MIGRYARPISGVALAALVCTAAFAAPQHAAEHFAFSNTPIADAVARVAGRFGASAVVVGRLDGRVTARFTARDLRAALNALLPQPYHFRISDGRVVVDEDAARASAAGGPPLVLKPRTIDPVRAASLLAGLFPNVRAQADARTGSVIVFAAPADAASIQAAFESLDTRGSTTRSVQAFPLHLADPQRVAAALRRAYPDVRVESGPNRSLIVSGTGSELSDVGALISSIDAPPAAASAPPVASESVTIAAARPADVARAVNRATGVHAAVSGQSIVLYGNPDALARAKTLAAELDVPSAGVRYTQVYRLRFVQAGSIAALVQRTFPTAQIDVDTTLNAFSSTATLAQQQRIADAVAQLDTGPSLVNPAAASGATPLAGSAGLTSANGTQVEVVALHAAAPGVPGTATGASTTAVDIALAVNTALAAAAPDLHVTVPPNNPSQLILTGSAQSIALAKGLIAQLDVAQKLVVLDTEIYEVDESASKDLGLSLGANPVITTTFTETPATNAAGVVGTIGGVQPLTRTPISFTAQLGLSITRGNARILANPRITTISGRTATIRAGENISILTTNGGGTGVAATTQLQTFQTGVTLDITPVINAGNFITVALHPVVNSLAATTNGIPQISTRDTQTTVAMQENQTLVIGGLIEDNSVRSESRIPFLGDLPLIGRIFRESTLDATRNELIITVTPHVLDPGQDAMTRSGTIAAPSPEPLLTVPPNAVLPSPRRSARRSSPPARPAASAQITPPPFAAAEPPPSPTVPQPLSSAFAQTNTFTYGAAPANNYAAPGAAVQIFYATFAPTVVHANSQATVSAITTSNAARVTIGTSDGVITQLSQVNPGQWQGTYTIGAPSSQTSGPLAVQLIATSAAGAETRIRIPVTVTP